MAKSKKDFTLLLIALFCSSLAHAQKQVPAERKDSGSPDKPGGLSIQLCKSEKKEFYIRYSS